MSLKAPLLFIFRDSGCHVFLFTASLYFFRIFFPTMAAVPGQTDTPQQQQQPVSYALQLQQQLLEVDMPARRSELQASATNLPPLADHVEASYAAAGKDAPAQQAAFQQAQNFAVQALASVAYQIHNLSATLIKALDVQESRLDDLHLAIKAPKRVSGRRTECQAGTEQEGKGGVAGESTVAVARLLHRHIYVCLLPLFFYANSS